MSKIESKFRVVHIIDSFATGGLERQVFNMVLYDELPAYVICLSESGYFGKELTLNGKLVFNMRSNSVIGKLIGIFKIFRANRADIIHAHNQKAYFYGCLIGHLCFRTPVLMSKHGENFLRGNLSAQISKIFLRYDRIIVVSEKIGLLAQKYFGGNQERIKLVANGVPFDRPFATKSESVEKTLNLLAVGRLEEVKNYALLIRVFARLVVVHENVRLSIVGDGTQRELLEDLAESLGVSANIRFAGMQRDVNSFLEESDLLVISSDSEGLPLILLEAVSFSVPIVSTKVGAIPDILFHGESALLSSAKDEDALFENLVRGVSDPPLRNEIAKNAYQRIQAEYSIEASLAKHKSIYESIENGAHA